MRSLFQSHFKLRIAVAALFVLEFPVHFVHAQLDDHPSRSGAGPPVTKRIFVTTYEPPKETAVDVTTTSTTTTTASLKTTSIPREDVCDLADDRTLLSRLKDSGVYAEIYMAPDIKTAADQFLDLGGQRFTSPKNSYFCDDECEFNADLVRRVMKKSSTRYSIRRPRPPSKNVENPARSWWRDQDWSLTKRRKRSALEIWKEEGKNVSSSEEGYLPPERGGLKEAFNNDSTSKGEKRSLQRIFRNAKIAKRGVTGLEQLNSGLSKGVIGTTVALDCDEADEDTMPVNGYHICKSCHAVRQLPKEYFPRVLNEVICAEDNCLQGGGKCRQRFLPFKILKNGGSESCPGWRLVTIQLRTCCDCVLHPNSPFVKYVV